MKKNIIKVNCSNTNAKHVQLVSKTTGQYVKTGSVIKIVNISQIEILYRTY